ncbi:hypothetical protein IQ22_00913 [Pseudomonas duriflava]|uniref:DUF1850 domain-containing protein n=1 Tax=Pseudomonas duriflava TaxID=459528 RepID=A0A562QNQ6_9PSED|nr:DUF1850 domain-containing protein [Pseudomonas duriflava]TWI57696.1 hypothetical protein IQ22_00913 [Pseudomonas duriflava]
MIGLCLGMAGIAWAFLPISDFTLAWQHTIEKVRWEEDYHLLSQGLLLTEARVKGSGAGMTIPEDAILEKGSWRYHRSIPPLQPLRVGRTPEAGDYEICMAGHCQPMSTWLGAPHAKHPAVELWSCEK